MHATCFGCADHPQALKYMTLQLKMTCLCVCVYILFFILSLNIIYFNATVWLALPNHEALIDETNTICCR